jgi:HD-GYP domain-containing protein (c-di-GMP phosphodiesterase class II)
MPCLASAIRKSGRKSVDGGPPFSYEMTQRVRLYIIATVAASLAASAVVYWSAPGFGASSAKAVLCLGAIALLTQLLAYSLAKTATGSISFVPFLASAVIAPDWLTTAGVLLVASVVQLSRDLATHKKVFNIAQQFLSISMAVLMYRVVGGVPLPEDPRFRYFALLVLFMTFFVVNSVCVSGVVAVSERKRFYDVWSANTLRTLPYDLLSWPIIVCLAWVYVRYGASGAFMLAVPLLGLRQLYKVNWQLEKTNQELLELMVAAIEARDPYTSGHSRRVSENARVIAQIIGLRPSEVKRVEIAALLHDVGKIHEVFAPILQKPGRLTDEEHAIMQTHPIKSEELVSRVSQLRDIVAPVRHHHENWNGTGYPDGLAGELIPLASRVIMFADTIDAMTSDRPYRKALDEHAVRQELVKYRAKQFDPTICDALLSSARFSELFAHAAHQSLPHTQEVPKLRLART